MHCRCLAWYFSPDALPYDQQSAVTRIHCYVYGALCRLPCGSIRKSSRSVRSLTQVFNSLLFLVKTSMSASSR